MSEDEKSNFNEIIGKIMKKSLFTERQIEIILKQKGVLDARFGCSNGAYLLSNESSHQPIFKKYQS